MPKYTPTPKAIKNYTQADEQSVFVGKRKSVELLPNVLQTEPNKMFLNTTIDNLLSSGTTETLNSYWGRVSGKSFQPESDLFAPEHRASRLNYQLAPGISVTDSHNTVDVNTYINILDALKNAGVDSTNHDELMSQEGQTLNIPINIDMFVNYNNYYWLSDDIPVCEIVATVSDPIDIDTIIQFNDYTTPVLANAKQVEFLNGMFVKFTGAFVSSTSGDYEIDAIYIVEGVGTGNISFVKSEDANGNIIFNRIQGYSSTIPNEGVEIPVREPVNKLKDYVVMNRAATDKNSWARANQWYSVHAINEAIAYNNLDNADYLTNAIRGNRPIIEFDANMELYNAGVITATAIDDVEHLISSDFNPYADINGQTSYTINGAPIENGEDIMFIVESPLVTEMNDFNNRTWTVGGVGTSITLTPKSVDPVSLVINTKALINNADDIDNVGSEWYWTGTKWLRGQYKTTRGQSPLFNLYSRDGIAITGTAEQAFIGESIWRYAISSASVVDSELGFGPKYNSQVLNDFVFEFTLNTNRYFDDITDEYKQEVKGDYFYKNISTGKLLGCWETIRGDQRVPVIVTDTVKTTGSPYTLTLGVDSVDLNTTYSLVFDKNAYLWTYSTYLGESRFDEPNASMMFKNDTTYTITNLISDATHAIEFVDPAGAADANIITSTVGTTTTILINAAYAHSTVIYRSTSDNTISGLIYISNSNQSTLRLQKNGTLVPETEYNIVSGVLTTTANADENDIFETQFIPNKELTNAVYDTAPIFKYNAANDRINEISFTQVFGHFEHQLVSMPGYNGQIFGLNDYHKMPRLHNYGGTIRRQIYSPARMAYLVKNNETNPFNAINTLADEYSTFKTAFTNKVKQLWNTENSTTVREIVNLALTQINIGKSGSFKYASSDMVYFENFHETTHTFAGGTPSVIFTGGINKYGDTQNHIQVWVHEYDGSSKNVWKPLRKDIDYTVNATILTLLNSIAFDGTNDNTLKINWFKRDNNSFMPPSVVKLGFRKPTQVEVIGTTLIGHDGSEYTGIGTELYDVDSPLFDIALAALYDLELRITNNLVDKHSTVTDIGSFFPSVNRNSGYDWAATINKLDDWYNRWASRTVIDTNIPDSELYVNAGYSDENYHMEGDKFTWNYSTVGPKIGGWEGIYTYYFDTIRPHTHPWEMLGHRVKPSWWDANYNWTDTAPSGKREKLIDALKHGMVGNPTDTGTVRIHDIQYAKTAYDWDNDTLVTAAAGLNDPVTANVVDAPSLIDASRDFAFGDWGHYEAAWRATSDYQFAVFEVLMQLKPYTIYETYWKLNNIAIADDKGHQTSYFIDSDGITPLSDSQNIHNYIPEGGFVSEILINNGGTGHNSSSVATIVAGADSQATIDVIVASGAIVGAIVTDPGAGYLTDVPIVVTSDFGINEDLLALIDTESSLSVMGLNNAIVEWSSQFGVSSETLTTTISRLTPRLMIHMGGYSDKNILDLIVDTSLNGGRISIPSQDFEIILSSGAPVTTNFYSGVTVSKVNGGYSVTGYNMLNRKFTYQLPSTGGALVTESIGQNKIDRYLKFKNTTATIQYGHVFVKRQELFNFLVGLGEFYNRVGFDVNNGWIADAKTIIGWTLDSTITHDLSVNGHVETLTFEQGPRGFVQNIDIIYDGTSNSFDKDGRRIASSDLFVLRDETTTEFSTKTDALIFGLRVNIVEYEHVLSLKNRTQFNDIIYDATIGLSVDRIKIEGERTRNWNGRVEAPGYIVHADGISVNFESSVREVERDNINTESKTLNKTTRQTARFNVGYQEPTYLADTFVEDNAAYSFSKGVRKYKGTTTAIDAFAKNKGLFGSTYDYTINEEWMIRMGDYGDTSQRNPIEVEVNPDLIKSSPQVIRFNDGAVVDRENDLAVDIGVNDPRLVTTYTPEPFAVLPIQLANNETLEQSAIFETHFRNSGLPLFDEVTNKIKSVDDMASVYDSESEYALIKSWQDKVSYKLGDRVRFEGTAYAAIVNNTGLNAIYDPILIKGSLLAPTVQSIEPNLFINIDGQTISFYKEETSDTFNLADVIGTVANPTTTSTVIDINGTAVNLTKIQSVTTYANIVFTGTTQFPTITGDAGSVFTIDTHAIDFEAFEQDIINISALVAVDDALTAAGITPAGTVDTLSAARVTAFDDLRTAYLGEGFTTGQWSTWLQSYFVNATEFALIGFNIPYLQTELIAAAGLGYETQLQALLQNDIDILNIITGQSYLFNSVVTGAHITATTIAVGLGQYLFEYTADLLTGNQILAGFTVTTDTVDNATIKTWSLTEIVDHMNLTLSATNITVTAAADKLVITKVPTVNDTLMSLVDTDTGGTDVLTEVGMIAETKNSAVSTVDTAVALALSDIIDTINNAGISNITASASINQLKLTASVGNIVIDNATANNDLGIILGTYTPTQTTTTTSAVMLQIYDIVNQINAAGISGVTAANVANTVVLTSTNTSIIIHENGSANTAIGFEGGTTTATSAIGNTWDAMEWQSIIDPAVSNIWVIDDTGTTGLSNRRSDYNVYQILDFNIEIEHICAGIVNTDNAQVKPIASVDVEVGDYVMILGSTSTPSVDGIHMVTASEVDDSHFYIDEFIEELGEGGKMFVIRPVRFDTDTAMLATSSDAKYYGDNGNHGWQPGMYAYVDNDAGTNIGATYKVLASSPGGVSFEKIRSQIAKVDNTKLENVVVYDPALTKLTATLEIYDPNKGIFVGAIHKEIDAIQDRDSATYNQSTDLLYTLNNTTYWGDERVGSVWWDISNAIYLDYEQDDIVYTQSHWGDLYPTSTIDVYEWTKSTVSPTEYEEAVSSVTVVNGVELTGIPYSRTNKDGDVEYYWSEEIVLDNSSNREQTYFFFWVKNKTTVPTDDRVYTTTQLAELIADPLAYDIGWVAAANSRSLLINSLERYIDYGTNVVQINFANTDVNHHQEYMLMAENDPTLVIPEWLHNGLRDSVTGVNTATTTAEYTIWNGSDTYVSDQVVIHNSNFYISNVTNTNVVPNSITNSELTIIDGGTKPWSELPNAIDEPDLVVDWFNDGGTRTSLKYVTYDSPDVIPDLSLHKLNRVGSQIRPRQTWISNLTAGRRVLIEKINAQIKTINLVDSHLRWETVLRSTVVDGLHTYDVSDVWTWTSWGDDAFAVKQIDHFVNQVADLQTLSPVVGDLAKVQTSTVSDNINRESIYQYTDAGWLLKWKEKGTIKFSDMLWDYVGNEQGFDARGFDTGGSDFDPAILLTNIMDTLRIDIYVGQYLTMYNDLWFTMLHYCMSEQPNLDWAFKTSYIKLALSINIDEQHKKFIKFKDDVLTDFINEIKPYHTKLRDIILDRRLSDPMTISISDAHAMMITEVISRIDQNATVWNDLIIDGNDANSGETDSMLFTTLDGEIEFIYDGAGFDDSDNWDHADELCPTSLREAVEIRVHTNTSGATVDANSRSFRMFMGSSHDEASVINVNTTLSAGISSEENSIPVISGAVLWQPIATKKGVVWINNERIEYTHIENNVLLNCVRGSGGTSNAPHLISDVVYEGGTPHLIPSYDNTLRPAFNDFGKSIVDGTSVSPEAVFVKQNG